MTIEAKILKGSHVQLELLNPSHKNDLYHAAQDESIWKFNLANASGDAFYQWYDNAITHLEQLEHYPFTVRRLSDNKIIGSTRYYNIHLKHKRLAIGYTWYVRAAWGTYVNPECKLLLLSHAFDDLQMNRVEFFTDSRNLHSRSALKKLGAVEEGILRQHMIVQDGFIRDSVIFSIIKPDWQQIKSALQLRLNQLK